MCKAYESYKTAQTAARLALQKFIKTLPEANASQLRTVTSANASDKRIETKLNKDNGFKISTDKNKKSVKDSQVKREKSLNTQAGNEKVTKSFDSRKRIKSFEIGVPVSKGAEKGETPVSLKYHV